MEVGEAVVMAASGGPEGAQEVDFEAVCPAANCERLNLVMGAWRAAVALDRPKPGASRHFRLTAPADCVHRNVDVPASWASETTVLSAASHEIDVMPWIFGREVIRVIWMSPVAAGASRWRDPQVVILELEGGSGPVDGPDAWDGYRAAIVSQALLISMAQGGPVPVESLPLPELYRRCRATPSRYSSPTRI